MARKAVFLFIFIFFWGKHGHNHGCCCVGPVALSPLRSHVLSLPVADVLRGQTGAGFRVHFHRVPVGRQGQLQDARAVGRGEVQRLCRIAEAWEPSQLHSRLVDGQGQSGRVGHHDPGDARFAGRIVRALGEPGMGVGRQSARAFERDDGDRALRGHRQAVDHQGSRQGLQGECSQK